MSLLHQDLTKEKWQSLSFFYQMANIGAEIGRTITWKKKDLQKSNASFERGIELLDLTIEDKKNRIGKLKELCVLREVLVDYFTGEETYGFSDKDFNDYFYGFNYAAIMSK
ncbi:MAG: hypothetical protein A2908_01205 [Candidatus Staskawiczbacteria bacterium RIFCSPLOWO2_01_FULL_38_12b]|uniref:Uncharacterized protein n=1 Tax=Candidatus Staskawiczbacteria bacterium RIFCSPLOWO2_01_FULL_38_12b TaxID=1802214 RepID=A0A1G2IGY1_9BACT|nr:MAG: hypothetical protein A2908_01205 [Candidatus Staskawiczbacteria bacterium RIFCSPLOWO2_01_FULL_38_12b]